MHHRFTHASHGSAHHEAASASRPSQHGRLASRTCWTVAVSRSNEARATSCAYLQTAEETCDSMPSSIAAPVTCGVPVSRGRARLATAVNVARTPARHRATIRTTPWRHETSARNGGTARSFVQLRPLLPCSSVFKSLFRMGAFSPFPLFRAHAHSVLQSLAGEPQAAPVSPQSAFAVTPPLHARTVKAAGRLRVDRASHAPFFAQMHIKSSLCLRKSRSCNRSRLRHERAGARAHIYTYADA